VNLAECEKIDNDAWAEYTKIYEKAGFPALGRYDKRTASAFAQYQKIRDTAWAEFTASRAEQRTIRTEL